MSVWKVECPSKSHIAAIVWSSLRKGNANRKEFRASERTCACEIGLGSQFTRKMKAIAWRRMIEDRVRRCDCNYFLLTTPDPRHSIKEMNSKRNRRITFCFAYYCGLYIISTGISGRANHFIAIRFIYVSSLFDALESPRCCHIVRNYFCL